MSSFYLNSYLPLVGTKNGRAACERMRCHPFVDGSIRREPDLEHALPAISCLCRGRQFTPRLQVSDVVAYVLNKRRYVGHLPTTRLTAVLRVTRRFETHLAAAEWYGSKALTLPNNLVVPGNEPKPLNESHQKNKALKHFGETLGYQFWCDEYASRARDCGIVMVCEPLFIDLTWKSPVLSDKALLSVFGNLPSTQNPGKHTITEGQCLLDLVGIGIKL